MPVARCGSHGVAAALAHSHTSDSFNVREASNSFNVREANKDVESMGRWGIDPAVLHRNSVLERNISAIQKWECYKRSANLPAVTMINHGEFDELTVRDVTDLFYALDQDFSGALDFSEVKLLLQELVQPPITDDQVAMIYNLTDKRDDRKVTPEELFRALTDGAVKQHLRRMQQENRIHQLAQEISGANLTISRELLIETITSHVERDDAFRTLPVTLFFLSLFICLVILHLNVFQRQEVETGLEEWMRGYAEPLGPNIYHVSNSESMWNWMNETGLQAVFGSCADVSGMTQCKVGPRHELVGDVAVRLDGGNEQWLVKSTVGKSYLASNPGDYLGAAREELTRLRASAPPNLEAVGMTLVTFVEKVAMFAVLEVKAEMRLTGFVVPSLSSSAVPIDPYPASWMIFMIIVDAMYGLFILYLMCLEVLTICKNTLMNGIWDGLKNYISFWNLVDWLNIIMGVMSMVLWLMCCLAMYATGIQSILVNEGDVLTVPETMKLDSPRIEQIGIELVDVIYRLRSLHIIMGLNTVSIMLKFFKAFTANPRLALVTNTLKRSATDILHFGIVFLAVFIAFAIAGHILFGSDIVQFSSVEVSINTAFVVLMGEFSWYAENGPEAPSGLNSGMPRVVIIIWFWLYMMLVLLILLNMLLAIILEHYTELVAEVKMGGAETLYGQAKSFVEEHRNRGQDHIKLGDILLALSDDDGGVHADKVVSHESLKRSFPEMGPTQINHIMRWLTDEARDRESKGQVDALMQRMNDIEKRVNSVQQDTRAVKLNVAMSISKLRANAPVETDMTDIELENIDIRGQERLNVAARLEYLSLQVAQLSKEVQNVGTGPTELQDLPRLVTQLASVADRASHAMRGTPMTSSRTGTASTSAPAMDDSVVSYCWRQPPSKTVSDMMEAPQAYERAGGAKEP